MSLFTLAFKEGPLGTQGVATYTRRDLALVYARAEDRVPAVSLKRGRAVDAQFGIYDHPVFLIAETLTLKFDEDRALVALDAYTNADLWTPAEEESRMKPAGHGRLQIKLSSDSDRISLATSPRFGFARLARRLHIFLDSSSAAEIYFEVGTNLTVGLARGELQEIVISDLISR